jgi:ATPase subunit of ABC transporter with duplicated ATPase domains
MASALEDLEAAVLRLPEKGRARLARVLLSSLGEAAEEGVEQAWIEEAQHRYEEIQSGDVEAQDSDAVFQEARASVPKQTTSVRPLRIALMGAHGTGKTTLANALVGSMHKLGIRASRLSEAPRIICDRAGNPGFFRRGQNTPLRQDLIFIVHLIQELDSLLSEAEVLVSDRSLLDHWAYTLHLFAREFEIEDLQSLYEGFILDHCRLYDVIFFFR